MARRLRIQYPGAIYQVTARGNGRQDIVCDDDDRGRFMIALGRAVVRCSRRIYAFVLMANHLHLVVRTSEPNLARGMQGFLSTYANVWARRHHFGGHVFQGREENQVSGTVLGILARSPSWPEGGFEPRTSRRFHLPGCRPVRLAGTDATRKRLRFDGAHGPVHRPGPVGRTVHWPGAELGRFTVGAVATVPKAAPPPILRPLHQAGPERGSLDVSTHGKEMLVRLDRKRLESPLGKVAAAGRATMGMPALGEVKVNHLMNSERSPVPLGQTRR
jgi:REP element-mobilizing transposase RayT